MTCELLRLFTFASIELLNWRRQEEDTSKPYSAIQRLIVAVSGCIIVTR
jgi:hypothetical protein